MSAWREVPVRERRQAVTAGRRGLPLPDPARGLTLLYWSDAVLKRVVGELLWTLACLAVYVVLALRRGGSLSWIDALFLAWFAGSIFRQCSRWYSAAGVARHRELYAPAVAADATAD